MVDEQQLPPYVIEGARSGRSRCKTCRRTISKGALRIGVLIEGPFGAGHLWHHLSCLARSRFDEVERAYELEAWRHARELPSKLPSLASLAELSERSAQRRQEQRSIPHVELAPSSRSRCKGCGEAIAEGAPRVVMGREVSFGQQQRTTPVKLHPRCVAAELAREDCAVSRDGFAEALRTNTANSELEALEKALAELGEL